MSSEAGVAYVIEDWGGGGMVGRGGAAVAVEWPPADHRDACPPPSTDEFIESSAMLN